MLLDGKVVVVTGASMGIGEAVAKLFADNGARVVLSSRDQGRAEAARARIGHSDRTLAVACDVRNREEIDRLLSLTLHNFGRVDVWINNAGHGLLDTVAAMDMRQCRNMFETNFFGTVEAMQALIPVMRQQGSGTIINVSSVAGHIPLANGAAYSATKFAMNAIGKAARVELLGTGVHVMTCCPGYVATDFSRNAVRGAQPQRVSQKVNRGISAERVARALLAGYLKQKREVVVPWWDHILIKLYQFFPSLVEWGMARLMRPADQIQAEAAEPNPR
jgi:short-subunit dehydrogenase